MKEVVRVNALGDACPIPVVKTKKALQELQHGGIVETHVDNEIAVQNLTKMARQMNLEVAAEKRDDHHYVVTINADDAYEAIAKSTPEVCNGDGRENIVVVIDNFAMGSGKEDLGRVLMKGFIYALSQQDRLPAVMLFYNGGATLTAEGSESLEDLKKLEAQGVVIKTCGTCINSYGLPEKPAVGEVTNMYDITTILLGADKVIQP